MGQTAKPVVGPSEMQMAQAADSLRLPSGDTSQLSRNDITAPPYARGMDEIRPREDRGCSFATGTFPNTSERSKLSWICLGEDSLPFRDSCLKRIPPGQ
ncbi:hypothetical protein TWF173_005515 [Orbilia oligospora]|nr:hypothetical protein TWF173_005515 [Orbilia oligospora]